MLHQVGEGALGPVFRTYEPTRDRLVAVKVFRLDVTPEQARALADELARTADAGLFHPSIVEPLEAGVEGTVAYRAEEYVAAESLDVAMRHYAPAGLDKVLPLLTQLAGAIDFARAAGVGHGALHPRDVFVTPDEARATGFGVVDVLERLGLRAPVRRPYSSPERVDGLPWGSPADVFSLAVIVFELLTGRRPAGTGDQMGSLDGTDLGDYPNHVRAVLGRAMHDNPDRRYPTALAFAAALEAAARGEGAQSPAPTPVPVPLAAAARARPPDARDREPVLNTDAAEPDDISAEREGDEAHWALSEREQRDLAGVATGPLYADEAVEAAADELAFDAADLALTETPRHPRPGDDFGNLSDDWTAATPPVGGHRYLLDDDGADAPAETDEEVPVQPVAVAPIPAAPHGPVTYDVPDRSAVVYEEPPGRARSLVPWAAILLMGLLLGFAAGYAVFGGDRRPAPTPQTETAATVPGSPADLQGRGAQSPVPGGTQGSGAQWSEHPVAPSGGQAAAAPPPIPAEAPPDSGAARPPAAPRRGRLIVRSTPSGAAVTINGEWRGRTPLTLSDLSLGDYVVRVVQPGYEVAREELTLSAASATRTMNLQLRRQVAATPRTAPSTTPRTAPPAPAATPASEPRRFTGAMYVDSRPRGAKVFINGKEVGTTPMRVPEVRIGSHVVRLELPDHRVWTASVRIAAGEEERVTGSLEPIR